jgi:hypothetical protein
MEFLTVSGRVYNSLPVTNGVQYGETVLVHICHELFERRTQAAS